MDFILNNYAVIATALIVVIGLILLLQTKYKGVAAGMLVYLCLQIENDLGGGGTGPFKFSAVLAMIYGKLPALAKLIITKKQMEALIEAAVIKMKEYLLTIDQDEIIQEETAEVAE